jgi:hypothetical protein
VADEVWPLVLQVGGVGRGADVTTPGEFTLRNHETGQDPLSVVAPVKKGSDDGV